MAKKNIKKTKTMKETISDAKKFLNNKKPKRQGTMESVALEAQDYLRYTEDAYKKRQEEKKALQKRANDALVQKKPKRSKKITKDTKKDKPKPATPTKASKAKVAPAAKAKASAKNDKKAAAAPAKPEPKKAAVPKKAAPAIKKDTPKKSAPAKKVVEDKPTAKRASVSAPVAAADSPKKDVAAKKKPVKQVSKLIESGLAAGMIDIVFCVDTTGSMDQYLEKTKDTVNKIVEQVKEKSKGESVSVRFSMVAYRDHPEQEPTYLTKVQDLCSADEILDYIKTLDCAGGGDGAEAVFDGLWESSKNTTWRDSKTLPSLRYIFHIADQPPHGDQYGGYSEKWGQTGCPCGIDVNKVAHIINIEQIHYRLIKIGPKLEKMSAEFKEKFTNYEEVAIDDATDMDIKITDMIIRELLPDTDMNLDI